jgi:hypothetical protein
MGKNVRAHFPYRELSVLLTRQFPQVHTIVSDAKLTAGNLHFQRPDVRTLVMKDVLDEPVPLQGDLLLVVRGDTGPEWAARFLSVYPLATVQQIGHTNLKMGYGSKESMSFDFVYLAARNP